MPGPPPKPDHLRRRRNAVPPTTKLPAEGRQGEPPAWPLSRPTKAERAVWGDLWSTPQAAAWERLGYLRLVARYCRLLVEVEGRDASVTRLAEARQLEDRLGLTPLSLLRLRWEIAEDELAQARDVPAAAEDIRRRIRAVD